RGSVRVAGRGGTRAAAGGRAWRPDGAHTPDPDPWATGGTGGGHTRRSGTSGGLRGRLHRGHRDAGGGGHDVRGQQRRHGVPNLLEALRLRALERIVRPERLEDRGFGDGDADGVGAGELRLAAGVAVA